MRDNSRIIPLRSVRTCPFDGSYCAYPCFKLVHGRMDSGHTDNDIAKVLGLSRSTWWRYRRGGQRPPLSVCGYLSALSGVLPWKKGWQRFSMNPLNGMLFRDDLRDGFTPEDITSLHWLRQELKYYRTLHAQYKNQSSQAAQMSGSTPLREVS